MAGEPEQWKKGGEEGGKREEGKREERCGDSMLELSIGGEQEFHPPYRAGRKRKKGGGTKCATYLSSRPFFVRSERPCTKRRRKKKEKKKKEEGEGKKNVETTLAHFLPDNNVRRSPGS